uniref:Uncharacterized protein n=1 Tax=Arundo donax TaxID=35708 RepID=A0A0A9BW81_ARUDO
MARPRFQSPSTPPRSPFAAAAGSNSAVN